VPPGRIPATLSFPLRRLLALFALLLLAATPLASGGDPADETRMTLRASMFRLINRDRKQFGLTPVQLDLHVSSAADAYCRAQIRNRTTGHFTTDGQSPYMRYSFAGGNDAVSENAAAWSAGYSFDARSLYEMLRTSEESMMREVEPHDGHRRTILDPYATHVGIGVAWDGGELRITQEFIRHYLDWTRPLPRESTTAAPVLCSGRPRAGYIVEGITVHHEPLPQPMSPTVANRIDGYHLPEIRREYLPRLPKGSEYHDGRTGDFPLGSDGGFAFVVPFPDGPGIYTVVVWVRKPSDNNTISASTVSIRVDGARGVRSLAGMR
jgi:uncharacterized protein YkwD